MKTKMMAAAIGMVAALVASAMPEAISYRGQITPYGRAFTPGEILPMTFRIYDSREPGKALWGRRIPVSVAANGTFYVELKDSAGVNDGMSETSLARACAAVRGDIEIGLTPPDSREFPHQVLRPYSRVDRARLAAETGTATYKKTLSAEAVTVNGDIRMPGGTLELSETAEDSFAGTVVNIPYASTFGGTNQTVVLRGGVSGWGTSTASGRDRVGLKVVESKVTDGESQYTSLTPTTVVFPAGTKTEEGTVSVQSF